MKKKTTIVLIITIFLGSLARAQTTSHVNLELWGVYNFLGVSLDSRLGDDSHWGGRIGLGYGFGRNSGKGRVSTSLLENLRDIDMNHVVSVPLNVYYLVGKNDRNFLELGAGVTPYYANFSRRTYNSKGDSTPAAPAKWEAGYFVFVRPTYRYEGEMFTLSIGLDIPINTPGAHFVQLLGIYPRLSVGYKL